MADKNKNEEIEDQLVDDLDEDYEGGSSKKLMIIGGGAAAILVLVAFILSFMGGSDEDKTSTGGEEGTAEEGTISKIPGAAGEKISYEEDYSRNTDGELADKTGEPAEAYPAKTSGARVPVDSSGQAIAGVPIQKSLLIDDLENPFRALHTIAPEIYELMEINFYDTRNESIPLGTFVERTRMSMPEGLFNRLDNFYRVFMYRSADEKGPGTALVFSTSIGEGEVKNLMKSWEGSMVGSLKPFVLIGLKTDLVAASGATEFKDSGIHSGGRYIDFSNDGVVSLNYLVSGKYIIIANSRSSFEKAIDTVNK